MRRGWCLPIPNDDRLRDRARSPLTGPRSGRAQRALGRWVQRGEPPPKPVSHQLHFRTSFFGFGSATSQPNVGSGGHSHLDRFDQPAKVAAAIAGQAASRERRRFAGQATDTETGLSVGAGLARTAHAVLVTCSQSRSQAAILE